MRIIIVFALFLCLIASCSQAAVPVSPTPLPAATQTPTPLPNPTDPPPSYKIAASGSDAFSINHRLARGVNFGNALEAPNEGDWGVIIKAEFFPAIKAAGFSSIRVPIGWAFHAAKEPPYTIDPEFIKRVDWVVDQAQKNGLITILDMHNYPEMMTDPQAEKPRFLAIWDQIANHFQSAPDDVLFELLNEPNGALNFDVWNKILEETIPMVRKTNPNRILVIGPAGWNGLSYLDSLVLPQDDQNIIVTFHYYDPFHFTHQGASWVDGSSAWLGTSWSSSPDERSAIRTAFDQAAAWATQYNRPLYLGEFGCFSTADPTSRLAWTSFIVRQVEARNVSWGYWNFSQGDGDAPGFGVYDSLSGSWRKPLLDALIPPPY